MVKYSSRNMSTHKHRYMHICTHVHTIVHHVTHYIQSRCHTCTQVNSHTHTVFLLVLFSHGSLLKLTFSAFHHRKISPSKNNKAARHINQRASIQINVWGGRRGTIIIIVCNYFYFIIHIQNKNNCTLFFLICGSGTNVFSFKHFFIIVNLQECYFARFTVSV